MSRTTSPPRLSTDLAGERASVTGPSQISLEEENVSLRKQVRQLETDARMNKALTEQQIELLQTQIAEFQEREINLKKMNETIMLALNDISKDQNPLVNKTAKELELATERHNKEMQEYRARTNELIKNLEVENKKLKEGTSEHELRIKELTLHFEKAQMGHYQSLTSLEQEKAELENKMKRLEEEKQLIKESNDNEIVQKINELKSVNERLKEENRKELQRSKEGYEKSIQDMKASHENEKKNMEARMGKLQELLLQEGGRREASTAEIHNKYQKEIQSLKDTINEIKTEHAIETNELGRLKQEASDKAEKLDGQVKKLKTMVKTAQESQEQNTKLLKDKLDKAKSVMEHGENIMEENKKYKQKIVELKSHVKKLEVSEQKLKDMVHEKDLQISEDRFEFRKMLNFDQSVMSQSVHEPRLSQSMNQGKLMHQTSATKSFDEPQSYTNRRSINSGLLPPSVDARLGGDYSPLREKSLNVDSRPVSSHRYNRTVSSPVSITPPKHSMKTNENDPENERPTSVTHRKTEVTERKTYQNNSPLRATPVNDEKVHQEAYTSNTSASMVQQQRKAAPLETSFADHGFAIENEMEPVRVETSGMDRRRDSKDKKTSRPVDIETIPINYNEFIKRTQRSSDHAIDPDKLLQNETEVKTENTTEAGPQIFFTTSQDDNPPLFGTSHFVFEGIQDVQEDEDVPEKVVVPVKGKSGEKRKLANFLEQGRQREKEREREKEKEKRLQYERELARKLEEYDQKTSTLEDDDFDIVEISDTNEGVDDDGLSSVRMHRRRSSAKSYVREDMDTRPSMMNPMNTVYESDGFNEVPTSIGGFLSGHPRSVMDRDREREREREKIFSTRCSMSNSIYRSDTGVGVPGVKSSAAGNAGNVGNSGNVGNNNESRQKIEGRLKDLEWKLKDMELKNKGLKVEKDKVQFEFEKLLQELKDKKAESESIKSMASTGVKDEKREDREGALKNEIKFLINKLLKVKGKLEKQSEELNVTRSINTIGQSQINNSISGYYLPGKKDYSREYGTAASGGYQNVSRERENWNPMHMKSESMSMLNAHNMTRNDYSDILNSTSTQLNTSVSRLDKYKVPETRQSVKGLSSVPLESLVNNARSKSNARYDYSRGESNNASVQNSAVKNKDNAPISTNRTHRSRMPNIPRPDEVINSSLGNLLGRDVLRSNINTHNYESYNLNNVSSGGYDTVSKFIYQRKSTR